MNDDYACMGKNRPMVDEDAYHWRQGRFSSSPPAAGQQGRINSPFDSSLEGKQVQLYNMMHKARDLAEELKAKDYEMSETTCGKTPPTADERYEFTAHYPDRGAVSVSTFSENGDINDIVDAFRGFLIALGFASNSIDKAFRSEW